MIQYVTGKREISHIPPVRRDCKKFYFCNACEVWNVLKLLISTKINILQNWGRRDLSEMFHTSERTGQEGQFETIFKNIFKISGTFMRELWLWRYFQNFRVFINFRFAQKIHENPKIETLITLGHLTEIDSCIIIDDSSTGLSENDVLLDIYPSEIREIRDKALKWRFLFWNTCYKVPFYSTYSLLIAFCRDKCRSCIPLRAVMGAISLDLLRFTRQFSMLLFFRLMTNRLKSGSILIWNCRVTDFLLVANCFWPVSEIALKENFRPLIVVSTTSQMTIINFDSWGICPSVEIERRLFIKNANGHTSS